MPVVCVQSFAAGSVVVRQGQVIDDGSPLAGLPGRYPGFFAPAPKKRGRPPGSSVSPVSEIEE